MGIQTPAITKLKAGAAVRFPFELKDAFRKAFPSAKWNRDQKLWEVGPRSIKRLEAWVQEVRNSGVIEDLAARDEADLGEREIEDLQAEIERVRAEAVKIYRDAGAANERKARAEELRDQLEASKDELAEARAAATSAQEAANAVAADVERRITHITTRREIEALRSEMKRNWIPKAYARSKFKPAQERLVEMKSALADAGIYCEAVTLAAAANFNRRDRDFDDLRIAIEFYSNA